MPKYEVEVTQIKTMFAVIAADSADDAHRGALDKYRSGDLPVRNTKLGVDIDEIEDLDEDPGPR